jgi:hypothetical protein
VGVSVGAWVELGLAATVGVVGVLVGMGSSVMTLDEVVSCSGAVPTGEHELDMTINTRREKTLIVFLVIIEGFHQDFLKLYLI